MADNTTLNTGTGGDVIASDDIGGVKFQRVKLIHGIDGVNSGDVAETNPLPVEFPFTLMDTFGKAIFAQYANDIDINFALSAPSDYTTVTTASGGTATTVTGMMSLAATTTTNSQATSVSIDRVKYRAGGEIYALFTTTFTAGAASTYQRIGLYNATNGFFIGREGTTFGFTVRQNSVDSQTALASFSSDTLSGAAGSLFTRNGTPEAIDLTKLNIWRVRFGWLGAAPVKLEVVAPDGHWVLCHVIRQPNLAASPHIYATDLPITADVRNSASTALTMNTACWGAGTTNAPTTRRQVRYYATTAAAGTTTTETAITLTRSIGTAATSTGTSFVIPRGKVFRITALSVATRGNNTATAQTTTFNLRVNTAGAVITSTTPIILAARSATPATANAWDRVIVPLPDGGIEINGDGTLQFGITAAATYTTNAPTWDVTMIGYEY